ncbi:MAG: c-type cytochrome [Salinarimonas sp.]
MRDQPSRRQQMMTRHSPGLFGAAVLLLAITSPALADVEQGRIIAERWCAACHLVGPGQVTASDQVTTFAEVARREDLTTESLRRFLQMPHPPMPDLQLSHRDIRALIAYIESLE